VGWSIFVDWYYKPIFLHEFWGIIVMHVNRVYNLRCKVYSHIVLTVMYKLVIPENQPAV
jgi:hypothetical protein